MGCDWDKPGDLRQPGDATYRQSTTAPFSRTKVRHGYLAKATTGAGFTPGGSERFKNSNLPAHGGAEPNWICQNCGGTMRGQDRQGFHRCACEDPSFPQREEYRATLASAMQGWHKAWAAECFRVLVPGGIIKAFGGTRTFHRLAVALTDAGFQNVRLEAWVYGSGFPKSLDVSKAIDRQINRLSTSVESLKTELRRLFDASGKSRKQIDEECGFRACNYLSSFSPDRRPDPWFNVLPSKEKWGRMKQVLMVVRGSEIDSRLDFFFSEAEREILGYRKVIPGVAFSSEGPSELPVTIPATPEAKKFEGYGTALKPAWEPILVGRKP